jgi:hypothetical protein
MFASRVSRRQPRAVYRAAVRTARTLAVDVAILIAFAALGRRTHAEGSAIGGILVVAAPFVLGWLAAAALVRLDRAPTAVGRALRTWAIGVPTGLFLRWAVFGRGIAPGFVVVALVFTLVTLVGWRCVVWGVAGRRRGV